MKNLTLDYKSRIPQDFFDETVGLSDVVSNTIDLEWEMGVHFYDPVSRRDIDVEFFELVKRWKNETEFCSMVTDICMHPAYQRIIGMGSEVLPLIFLELGREPNHWFWALTAITGLDLVPFEDRGNVLKMRSHWMKWAQDNNYIS